MLLDDSQSSRAWSDEAPLCRIAAILLALLPLIILLATKFLQPSRGRVGVPWP